MSFEKKNPCIMLKQEVISAISAKKIQNEFGLLVNEIIRAAVFSNLVCTFSFIFRKINVAAHLLVAWATRNYDLCSWKKGVPLCVLQVVLADKPSISL